MEVLIAALQLLVVLLGVLKACLELRRSGKDEDDHSDARSTKRRPKHLRG